MKKRIFRAALTVGLIATLSVGMAMQTMAAAPTTWEMPIKIVGEYIPPSKPSSQPPSKTQASSSGQSADSSQLQSSEVSDVDLDTYADEIFNLVNDEREKAGVQPLERNSSLDDAANVRASEVMQCYSHTRPDGTKWVTVLDEMDISYKGYGENLVGGRSTPKSAMSAWMASQGHRENILNEKYESIGIGVYQRPNGKIDWIQIFTY